MKHLKLRLITLALVALALVVPAFSTAAPPWQANTVTLSAPASVTFGRAITLSGAVTGADNSGVKVTIQQRPFPFTGQFKNVANATTDASGKFTVPNVLPQLSTQYQAVAKTKPDATSPAGQVNVRLAVTRRVSDATVKRGQRVRFSGVVKPAHNGQLVRIQRRTKSGSYRTVSKTLTVASASGQSAYAKKVRIRSGGLYRVRVSSGDGDHATGTSARKRIRVVG